MIGILFYVNDYSKLSEKRAHEVTGIHRMIEVET